MISNADLRFTVDELLRDSTLAPEWRRWPSEMTPSFPCFLTHLGLEGVDPHALERAQGYYWNSWDPDDVGRNGLRCKIFVPTLLEPALAPEGGQIVILQKVLDPEVYGEAARLDPEAHKRAVEGYIVAHLETVVPGVTEKIRTKTSASAWTSERFTLNLGGAMLGWEMSPEQVKDRPPMAGPVENLHLVGHWTRPGGGITPVIASAIEVAARVARPSS